MSVAGKIAIVTGGGSGIGHASARLLAVSGATVIVVDRNSEAAQATATEIQTRGGDAEVFLADVGALDDIVALVRQVIASHKRVDILLHAAGICPRKPLLEMEAEEWREVLRVNLDSTFFITREVGRAMADQQSGTIILVASDRGLHGSADYAHYAASKGGMLALTKSLALTLGKYGVTVNALNPGLTDTPLARAANPQWEQKTAIDVLGGHSLPEEIAEIVLFLASTAAPFMTGQIVGTRMRIGM